MFFELYKAACLPELLFLVNAHWEYYSIAYDKTSIVLYNVFGLVSVSSTDTETNMDIWNPMAFPVRFTWDDQ